MENLTKYEIALWLGISTATLRRKIYLAINDGKFPLTQQEYNTRRLYDRSFCEHHIKPIVVVCCERQMETNSDK